MIDWFVYVFQLSTKKPFLSQHQRAAGVSDMDLNGSRELPGSPVTPPTPTLHWQLQLLQNISQKSEEEHEHENMPCAMSDDKEK
jgi:hypothetical protein